MSNKNEQLEKMKEALSKSTDAESLELIKGMVLELFDDGVLFMLANKIELSTIEEYRQSIANSINPVEVMEAYEKIQELIREEDIEKYKKLQNKKFISFITILFASAFRALAKALKGGEENESQGETESNIH